MLVFAAGTMNWFIVRSRWYESAALLLAMAHVIMNDGLYDAEFIRDWTNVTADQLIEHLQAYTPEFAEKESGVPARDIRRIAREYAITKPATTF